MSDIQVAYTPRSPVCQPPMFCDRNREIESLLDSLRTKKSSCVIMAGTNMGKSSLLLRLKHLLTNELSKTGEDCKEYFVPAYAKVEMSSADHPDPLRQVLLGIVIQAASCINILADRCWHVELLNPMPSWRLSAGMNPDPFKDFETDLLLIIQEMEEHLKLEGALRLVLLIDEVYRVATPDLPKLKVDFARAFVRLIDTSYLDVLFVLACTRLVSEQLPTNDDKQLSSKIDYVPMDVLPREHCTQLMCEPLKVIYGLGEDDSLPQEVGSAIYDQVGGHPFLLHYIMSEICANVDLSQVSVSFIDQIVDKMYIKLRPFLSSVMDQIREHDLSWRILGQLYKIEGELDHSALLAQFPVEDYVLTAAIEFLKCQGVARERDISRCYIVNGELFRRWFSSKGILKSGESAGSEPGREIKAVGTLTKLPAEAKEKDKEEFTDFDLHIASNGHAIASSNQGQALAEIPIQVPRNVSLSLKLIEKRTADADLLEEVGQALYTWLFPGPIHTHFQQTEAVARRDNIKMRLRLRIEAEEIASLPLEFLYRRIGEDYIAVNPDTALSRYLNLPMPAGYVRRREGPLHMLAIIADPTDQTRLPPDEWKAIIKESLAEPLANGWMTLQTVKHATRKEIRNALLGQKPDIIQFVGHGIYKNGKGYLALVDESTAETCWLGDKQFAGLLLGYDDHLGLVSLATCESAKSDDPQGFLGIAPKLVQRGVPAVLSMQYKVYIKTAKVFLEEFYTAVAARKPIDWATQSARNAISLEYGLDNREFATPVLYMRAKDGNIF